MILGFFLVFLLVSALILALVNALAMRTQPRHRRGYFFWGAMCQVLALLFIIGAILVGWQYEPARGNNNAMPFVYFVCLFFMPAGLVLLLVGIFEPSDEEHNPRP